MTDVNSIDVANLVAGATAVKSEDPVDLWQNVHAPSPIPLDALPESIRTAAYVMPEMYPPNVLARCMLCVMQSAVSAQMRLQLSRTWQEATGDWLALIGPPGASKSPLMNIATAPLFSEQTRIGIAYRKAREEWEAIDKKSERGPAPVFRVLSTVDATLAALGNALVNNPHGILLQHSELSALIASMDNPNAKQGAAERGHWLALADSIRSHTTLRIDRGVVYVPNWTACVLGAMTPDKLVEMVRTLVNDGLLARIAFVQVPELPITNRLEADNINATLNYDVTIGKLIRWHDLLTEVRKVYPSPEAKEMFGAQRMKCMEDQRIYGTKMARFAERISKYPGLLARMALALHCYEVAERGTDADRCPLGFTGSLSEQTMANAIAIMRAQFEADRQFYLTLDGAEATPGHALARRLADWILEHGLERFGLSDLQRGPRAWRESADDVHRQGLALEILEQFGWISWSQEVPLFAGRVITRGIKFTVNRLVRERFAVRAASVKQQAQDLRARMEPHFAERREQAAEDGPVKPNGGGSRPKLPRRSQRGAASVKVAK